MDYSIAVADLNTHLMVALLALAAVTLAAVVVLNGAIYL